MGTKVTLNQWPDSQTCIGCPFGQFVMGADNEDDDKIGDSAYICFKNKSPNNDCFEENELELKKESLQNHICGPLKDVYGNN